MKITTYPATYELDPVTGEATGVVHPYCSIECQSSDTVPGPTSIEPTGGEEVGDEATKCETCGTYLP